MTREAILKQVQDLMVELFELDRETVTLEAHLIEDLDLDSIDAIDMVVKLQEMTGRRVEEETLREIRTIKDIVDLVETQTATAPEPTAPEPTAPEPTAPEGTDSDSASTN